MVQDHESYREMMYRNIVRLRTDIFFYGEVPTNVLLSNRPIFPIGKMGCSSKRPCVNDHIVFLPRMFANTYFDLADEYVYCGTGYIRPIDASMWSYSEILHEKFQHKNFLEVDIPYTLLRLEYGPVKSCKRAGIRSPPLSCNKCVEYASKYFPTNESFDCNGPEKLN